MRIAVLLIVIAVYFFAEIYSYFGLTRVSDSWTTTLKAIFWGLFLVFWGAIVIVFYVGFTPKVGQPIPVFRNVLFGLAFTILVTKLIFALVLGIGDITDLMIRLGQKLSSSTSIDGGAGRRKFIAKLALGVASVPFASFLYGITFGKYNYKIRRVKLVYDNLPKAFEGYKIVQISDFHAGSLDSVADIAKGVELINSQNPDVILFTGDLVNNIATEVEPFIDTLKALNAPDGLYSITGNHDYGEYQSWNTVKEKENNFKSFLNQHKRIGFDILMNENRIISRGDDRLVIAGVENWGNPPFPQYGDLQSALLGTNREDFIVLMSHDPSHWDEEVKGNKKEVNLTLSGHTHGMQFGVEIPGFKWSPVKYKYPKWAGLYSEDTKKLYVNRGFGFIGFPGRVGIMPEITVLELSRNNV